MLTTLSRELQSKGTILHVFFANPVRYSMIPRSTGSTLGCVYTSASKDLHSPVRQRESAYLNFKWTRKTVTTSVVGFIVVPAILYYATVKTNVSNDGLLDHTRSADILRLAKVELERQAQGRIPLGLDIIFETNRRRYPDQV